MKKIATLLAASCALVLFALPVQAEEASVELGHTLFNDAGLGASKNDKSCNTCHENGKGMEKAGASSDLAALINKCIKGPLQGEGISEDTVAMESLKLYIKSLAK
ncbi:MAG: cytochrome-c peroxidase [Proteobacteria bacterium]|nr:cytochrome-c peroxidase [Pseudomonadota bacterium]MBU0966378.1 cytochrome-c peroxidase [Pseudomonadota bacterium]